MNIRSFYKILFFLFLTFNYTASYSSDFVEEVRTRGGMLHFSSLDEYFKLRENEKKLLVVGCGHGAFKYDESAQKLRGMHSYDQNTQNHLFSHSDAFTITANDGDMGAPLLYPDVDGFFPNSLPSYAKFNEIFFECINGGTVGLYEGAYEHLDFEGVLIDDRYTGDSGAYSLRKARAIDNLIKVGFTDIEFEDDITNPRNKRNKQYLVIARKLPDLGKENPDHFIDKSWCITDIKKIDASDDYNYNIELNRILRGYYRNLPKIFNELYLKYRKNIS